MTDPTDSAAATPPEESERELSELRNRVEELTRSRSALLDDQQRFRRRLEREHARVLGAERARLAGALLETLDDLDRCVRAVRVSSPIAAGLRAVRDALQQRIAGLGVERLTLTGQRFDPALAEAVEVVSVGEETVDGAVVDEIAPGYRAGEHLVRPARVRVGRYAPATT